MKQYIATNIVNAMPMKRLAYTQFRGWQLPVDENGDDDGYLVENSDIRNPKCKGHVSWSPKDVFEKNYHITSGMTFGEAIQMLKVGGRVARHGWNGKGMYLWLLPAATIKSEWCREPHLKAKAEANGGEIECLGSIRMFTADCKVLTGWLASQTDMFAEDWVVVG